MAPRVKLGSLLYVGLRRGRLRRVVDRVCWRTFLVSAVFTALFDNVFDQPIVVTIWFMVTFVGIMVWAGCTGRLD